MEQKAEVRAKLRWNATGIQCGEGTRHRIAATGTWCDASIKTDAKGYPSPNCWFRMVESRRRQPNADWFSLIAAIGGRSGPREDIGKAIRAGHSEVTAEFSGELYCFANDLPFLYWNNSGAIQLSVTGTP